MSATMTRSRSRLEGKYTVGVIAYYDYLVAEKHQGSRRFGLTESFNKLHANEIRSFFTYLSATH